MKERIAILLNIIIQIIFIVYFNSIEGIDVFKLLLLIITPMLLSVIFILFINLNSQRVYWKIFVYTLPNLAFNIMIVMFVQSRVAEILGDSLKYNSTNIKVSASSSPYASLILLIAVSVGLHYTVGQAKLAISRK